MTGLRGNCPTGCGRKVPAGKLMDAVCWGRVPADLQARVYRTWGAWQKDLDNDALRREYREARDNAVAAIA
jgi:hypothetical protein